MIVSQAASEKPPMFWRRQMINAIACIRKEKQINVRRPSESTERAELKLLREDGNELGLPRYFSGFQEIGNLLQHEVKLPFELIQNKIHDYDNGDEVRILLTLESEETIRDLGFDPQAT
jgi:hypothetical protein